MTGVITRIIHGKGYGFVEDENGQERFLHIGDLIDENIFLQLKPGHKLEFEPFVRPAKPGRDMRNGLGVKKVKIYG